MQRKPSCLAARLIATAAVLGVAAVAASAGAGQAQAGLVQCYDPDRRILQSKRSHACEGRVVDEAEARELREEIRQERLRRMGEGPSATREAPQMRDAGRLGSGFPVDGAGHILTAHHVVEGCTRLEVQDAAGERWPVELLMEHAGADLALLRGDRRVEPFAFTDPDRIGAAPGALAALGYPNAGLPTVRPRVVPGELSGADGETWFEKGFVTFQAPVRSGGSGGPLISEQGYLLGMVVSKVDTVSTYRETGEVVRDVSFAISAPVLQSFLEYAGVSPVTQDLPQTDAAAELAERTLRVLCGVDGR